MILAGSYLGQSYIGQTTWPPFALNALRQAILASPGSNRL